MELFGEKTSFMIFLCEKTLLGCIMPIRRALSPRLNLLLAGLDLLQAIMFLLPVPCFLNFLHNRQAVELSVNSSILESRKYAFKDLHLGPQRAMAGCIR
jgi:hypothetical protein